MATLKLWRRQWERMWKERANRERETLGSSIKFHYSPKRNRKLREHHDDIDWFSRTENQTQMRLLDLSDFVFDCETTSLEEKKRQFRWQNRVKNFDVPLENAVNTRFVSLAGLVNTAHLGELFWREVERRISILLTTDRTADVLWENAQSALNCMETNVGVHTSHDRVHSVTPNWHLEVIALYVAITWV